MRPKSTSRSYSSAFSGSRSFAPPKYDVTHDSYYTIVGHTVWYCLILHCIIPHHYVTYHLYKLYHLNITSFNIISSPIRHRLVARRQSPHQGLQGVEDGCHQRAQRYHEAQHAHELHSLQDPRDADDAEGLPPADASFKIIQYDVMSHKTQKNILEYQVYCSIM